MVDPTDEPFDDLRARQDNVLTYGQAVNYMGRPLVRRPLGRDRWQQPHPKVVVMHNGPLTPAQRRWLAVLAGPPDTCLAGPTAAMLGGLTGFRSEDIRDHPGRLSRARS